MQITRRDFLKYCGGTAAVLGLSFTELGQLEKALADPTAPTVLWLQGSGCTGCSVSLLNRISSSAPATAGDLLLDAINLAYHPNLMAAAGDTAVAVAEQAYNKGGYILAVEGGIPTAFDGSPCWAWNYNGADVTFQDAVSDLASRAAKIVCIGNCASWGGIAALPPNPTGVMGVKALTGKTTINIAGCPTHPDWIVWSIVQLLIGASVSLDSYGRPAALFGHTVHSQCPRREDDDEGGSGDWGECLAPKGCRGQRTQGNCPSILWNGGTNWCVNANAPCIGCTNPDFPGPLPLYQAVDEGDD